MGKSVETVAGAPRLWWPLHAGDARTKGNDEIAIPAAAADMEGDEF